MGWATVKAKQQLAAIAIEPVDMATVNDGTYIGETDAGLVKVKVQVRVEDHGIKTIDIVEHQNGLGKPAEAITKTMIAQNTVEVDAVSGATLSSQSIKSAVSKALGAGRR